MKGLDPLLKFRPVLSSLLHVCRVFPVACLLCSVCAGLAGAPHARYGVPVHEGRDKKMDMQTEWTFLSEMWQFQSRTGVKSAR